MKVREMYNEIKTEKLVSVIYNAVFCLRRLILILTLLLLEDKGFWLVFAFNFIQTLYYLYITNVRPYTDPLHNRLEYVNEHCLIMMQYMSMCFLLDVNLSIEA